MFNVFVYLVGIQYMWYCTIGRSLLHNKPFLGNNDWLNCIISCSLSQKYKVRYLTAFPTAYALSRSEFITHFVQQDKH